MVDENWIVKLLIGRNAETPQALCSLSPDSEVGALQEGLEPSYRAVCVKYVKHRLGKNFRSRTLMDS